MRRTRAAAAWLTRAPHPPRRSSRRSAITTFRFPEASFDLYFLATLTPDEAHLPAHALPPLWSWPRATLELTHNYGSETKPREERVYWTGNEAPHEGFACVTFTVTDGPGFMAAAAEAGVRILVPWTEGSAASGDGFGVIAEPSTGYAVRIVQRPGAAAAATAAGARPRDYAPRLLDTVLRVSDADATAAFYRRHFHANTVARVTIGGALPAASPTPITYIATTSHGGRVGGAGDDAAATWPYTALLTGYDSAIGLVVDSSLATAGRTPCSGNVDPGRGFGHVGFLVDDLDAYCGQLEADGVRFKKRPSEGRMRGIAFALDPDGYWIELIQRGWKPA